MATYVTPADYSLGRYQLPDLDLVSTNLQRYIDDFEPKLPASVSLNPAGFVYELMGKDLYTAYVADPTNERFTRLIEPFLKPGSLRYCYWFYVANVVQSQNTSLGRTQAKNKNSITISSYPYMVAAWNEMVDICRKFHKYMKDNVDTYPEYKVCFPEWFYGWGFWDGVSITWFFDWQSNWDFTRQRVPEIYRYKNSIGI